VPAYVDRAGVGGRFSDRLQPEIDVPVDPSRRRGAPLDLSDAERAEWDFREAFGGSTFDPDEEPETKRRPDPYKDMVALTSTLPSPVPETLIPAAVIRPEGRWRIRPVKWEQHDPRWDRWVNQTIDRYRGGHCVVVADCHI
jgi:hypothetical protein